MSDSRALPEQGGVDEGGSVVSGGRGRQLTALQKFGIAGLVLVVFLSFIWLQKLDHAASDKTKPDAEPALSQGQRFRAAPLTTPPAQPAPKLALPMPAAQPAHRLFPTLGHQETALNSPIMAFSGGNAAAAVVPAANHAAADTAAPAAPPGGPTPTHLSARLRPTVLDATKARLLPHPDFMITEGTIIPCTLQTAINSELAGYVKCVIPQDIRGTTGNVVLLDKGTTVVGEIQSGLIRGQDRVFVLWDRAETPDHAVITLNSPGADQLGRAGLPGTVNSHFWQRFGSAIMLSVIQGGLQAGAALAANSGQGGSSNSLFLNSFSNNGTELADTALQASINIPPTLEKNQGDNIAIFVARDLDFSDVYRLWVKGARYGQ